MEITAEKFDEVVLKKIASRDEAGRAKRAFLSYGRNRSFDVSNVLRHAIDLGKLVEVLEILEKHFSDNLQFQHPQIRGTDVQTTNVFVSICRDTLKIAPTTDVITPTPPGA